MSNLTELRQSAREYSGSYRITEDTRATHEGKRIFWIRYQNPNNITNNEYISFRCNGKEGSCVTQAGRDSLQAILYELS